MEIIRSLVQSLIVIIILAVFLEMLLPAGQMRTYVKMVMGLFIIVVVIQAMGELLHQDFSAELPTLAEMNVNERFSVIQESGEQLASEQEQKAIEQYKNGLANQVLALANIYKEVAVVEAAVHVHEERSGEKYGQIDKIVLLVEEKLEQTEPNSTPSDPWAVESVSVQVGSTAEAKEWSESGGEQPPAESVADLVRTIANFYNLKPEQVVCVYKS